MVLRFQKCLILLGKVAADGMIDRRTEEAGARHDSNAHQPDQIFTEFQIAVVAELGNVQQDIVCALRIVVDGV